MKLNINKDNWTSFKLGEIFSKKEENDKENAGQRFDRFLKVEHFDKESLHIKRWSSQKKGDELNPTFYKIFRKGQILFPTRNPHLRRTVLASFDGICGEKTLTLEPNIDIVNPKFIPFLFHSNSFYNHTTSAIVGSTNPHCRWRDVAKYEFLLPPLDQQAELAELLWAMDEMIERETEALKSLENFLDIEIENRIHGINLKNKTINKVLSILENKTKLVGLEDFGEIIKGKGIPKSEVIEKGIPCVRYGELYTKHHRIIREFHSFISEVSAKKSLRLIKGDVLFAGSGETITEIGKSAAFVSDTEAYCGSDVLIFRPHKGNGEFLGYLMNSQLVRKQLDKYGTGATVMHIYASDLRKLKIPLIEDESQQRIVDQLETVHCNIELSKSKISSSKALQKSLINQVF